jgi:hypothetical protein
MIKIFDIQEVIRCTEAVSQCVPSCKITVTSEGAVIFAKNEISRIRMQCKSDVIVSDSSVSFCIGELPKFLSLLRTINKYKTENETIQIEFNGAYLIYSGSRTSFKFGTIKEDIISKFIDTEIKATIAVTSEFELSQTTLKELVSSRSIVSDSATLRYLFEEDAIKKKMVFCSIRDTENPLSSEIRLHVGNCTEPLPARVIFNHDRILLMRAMSDVEICKISCTAVGVVLIDIQTPAGSSLRIYTAGLKN